MAHDGGGLDPPHRTATLTWPAVAGATGYVVYIEVPEPVAQELHGWRRWIARALLLPVRRIRWRRKFVPVGTIGKLGETDG